MPQQIRPIRIEGNLAYIPLTKGYEAVIDVEDVPLVEGKNWSAMVSRNADGSIRSVYAMRSGGGRPIYLHRWVMSPQPELEVDHRDGDGLNNRRRGEAGNLRLASSSQNKCNGRKRSDNKSGLRGVSWDKKNSRWRAQIQIKGRNKNLGRFLCKTAAAFAYAKASRQLHGVFGRIG